MQATEIDYIILFIGMMSLIVLAGVLAELGAWIMNKLGFIEEDPDPTDFIARLQAGEVLDKDNMFE
tara:strand:+ start:126 stop:323 length:198 start_codon:yes stop_codon:yes gene_type:complete